jgi:hypothetical protein
MNRIFEYTQGHPFEMQVLCYHLFNNQLSRRVGVEVWDKAVESALNDMGIATFNNWFNQASSEETKVLGVLATVEAPVPFKDIHEMIETGKIRVSSKNIPKYLQRLVEKKLINKTGRGLYFIPDRMFRTYIRFHSDMK